MPSTSRFEATASLQLHALISDLHWRLQMIESDIVQEERVTGNTDLASPTYSILALTLRARGDNLRTTIAMLERQVGPMPEMPRAA